MIKLWKKLPKGWKLGLYLTILFLLLSFGWMIQGYPSFSAEAAYRRTLGNAMTDEMPLELLFGNQAFEPDGAPESDSFFGLGHSGQNACAVRLYRDGGVWQGRGCRVWESLDRDVWVLPLPMGESFRTLDLGRQTPAAAVYCPGAAELKLELVLADCTEEDETIKGGVYPMLSLETEGDWKLFSFDLAPITAYQGETPYIPLEFEDAALAHYNTWITYFHWGLQHCEGFGMICFRLTARDAQGRVLGTYTLEL